MTNGLNPHRLLWITMGIPLPTAAASRDEVYEHVVK